MIIQGIAKLLFLVTYRDNFVKIQVFYGEIAYDSLEQSPAYNLKSLLGTV